MAVPWSVWVEEHSRVFSNVLVTEIFENFRSLKGKPNRPGIRERSLELKSLVHSCGHSSGNPGVCWAIPESIRTRWTSLQPPRISLRDCHASFFCADPTMSSLPSHPMPSTKGFCFTKSSRVGCGCHGSRRPFHPGRLTSQVVWFSTPVRQFCSLKGGFKPARQLVSTPARRSPLCRSSQRAARPCRRPLEVETAAPSIHSDTRNPPTRLWVDQ